MKILNNEKILIIRYPLALFMGLGARRGSTSIPLAGLGQLA